MPLYGSPIPASHVVLKKVSDGTTYPLSLALDGNGAPQVNLGSTPEEAANSGEMGVIKIKDLSGGPGQLMSIDPTRYEAGDGVTTLDGPLTLRGGTLVTDLFFGTKSFPSQSRGATYIPQSGFPRVVVLPDGIYQQGSRVFSRTGVQHTGSWAIFGRYIYFGVVDSGGLSSFVTMYDSKGDTYSIGTFVASFVASSGDKLWRAVQNINDEVGMSWTDDITAGSGPTFSSTFFTGGGLVRDLFVIGGQAVVAIHGVRHDTSGTLSALDTAGFFTPLVSNLPYIAYTTPYLGGQVIFTGEGTRAIWMSDVNSYQDLELSPFTTRWANAAIPRYKDGYDISTPSGIAAVSDGTDLYWSVFGTFLNNTAGGTTTGSAILRTTLTKGGFKTEVLLAPTSTSSLVGSSVLGMYVYRIESSSVPPTNIKELHFITSTNSSGSADILGMKASLWDGMVEPASYDGTQKYLRTSRYTGDHWHTKKVTRIRGMARSGTGNGEGTLKLYVDGAVSAIDTFIVTANSTPFSWSVAVGALGRDFALQWESTDDQLHELHLPLEIDYFAVPEEQDMVQLTILGGFGTPDAAGGVSDESRATVLANLQDVIDSGERWTLDWWDATPQWIVYPISYQTRESDPSIGEGTGAMIVTLTLRRV